MGGSPKQHSAAPSHGKSYQAAHSNAEQHSDVAEHSSGTDASGSDAKSGSHESSSAQSSDRAGSEVIVQSGERVDLPLFSSKLDKPMMEMVAGSNVWYQAHILQASASKLRVLFPAPTEGRRDKKEWVLRTSSRIWRGSMAGRDWKYLSQGAWAPKSSKSSRKAARKAARHAGGSGGSAVAKRSAAARSGGGGAAATGVATTGSGTGGAAGSEAAAAGGEERHGAGPGEEPDVASPRKRARHSGGDRNDSPASSGGGSPRADGGGSAEHVQRRAMDMRTQHRDRGARPRRDPLATWFEHHFALLDKAGLLGSSSVGASPEAGFLQLPHLLEQKGQQESDQQHVGGSSKRSKASTLAAA